MWKQTVAGGPCRQVWGLNEGGSSRGGREVGGEVWRQALPSLVLDFKLGRLTPSISLGAMA